MGHRPIRTIARLGCKVPPQDAAGTCPGRTAGSTSGFAEPAYSTSSSARIGAADASASGWCGRSYGVLAAEHAHHAAVVRSCDFTGDSRRFQGCETYPRCRHIENLPSV